MPQERSLVPKNSSGFTSTLVSLKLILPVHLPCWVSLVESMLTFGPFIRVILGSCTGSKRPSNSRLAEISYFLSSMVILIFFRGSITSTFSAPTSVFILSWPSTLEYLKLCWMPPATKTKLPSIRFKFG